MRLFWIFLGLAILFLIPFLIWGEGLGQTFSADGAISWLQRYGAWAWAGVEHPALAILLSAVLPPMLWLVVQPLFRARQAAD